MERAFEMLEKDSGPEFQVLQNSLKMAKAGQVFLGEAKQRVPRWQRPQILHQRFFKITHRSWSRVKQSVAVCKIVVWHSIFLLCGKATQELFSVSVNTAAQKP